MTVLHGDREHESIKSIDSMTQPSEHVCLDLAKHSSSHTYPTVYTSCKHVGTIPYVRKLLDLAAVSNSDASFKRHKGLGKVAGKAL